MGWIGIPEKTSEEARVAIGGPTRGEWQEKMLDQTVVEALGQRKDFSFGSE